MKSMPNDVNPFGALMITYLVAAIISAIIFVYMVGPSDVGVEISKINWTSVILALAIVGLEVGYVFVYRAGWAVSTASVVANTWSCLRVDFCGVFFVQRKRFCQSDCCLHVRFGID